MTVRIALFTDSHIHPEPHNPEAAYASDARHNDRSRAVVRYLNDASPDLVAHLGDITHPVPGRPTHEDTVHLAHHIYSDLDAPFVVVPGNHDVGDKPQGWATAPRATPERHRLFQQTWGDPWGTIRLQDPHDPDHVVRLIWLDSPILNSGLPMASVQASWLVDTLRDAEQAGETIIALTHYPPFLLHPEEPEHYDNVAQPARQWLLDTLCQYGTRALYCGHVHHIVTNRYRDMDIMVLPGISFIRPGYADLCRVSPLSENGREAPHKLGFVVLHIDSEQTHLEPVRLDPAPEHHVGQCPPRPSPLAVTLRHDWAFPRTIPAMGLDEFRRKRVRNDLAIWSLWELGIRCVRVPAEDLRDEATLTRWMDLHRTGLRLLVWSAGDAAVRDAALVSEVHAASPDLLWGWEVVTLGGSLPPLQKPNGVPLLVSILDDRNVGGKRFTHFPSHGWGADALSGLEQRPPGADGLVALVRHEQDLATELSRLSHHQERLGGPWTVQIEMPRGKEGERFDDDQAISTRIAAALHGAQRYPNLRLVLDTFIDLDRGYYARNGILDGRFRPRPAWHHLRQSVLSDGS